MVDAGRKKVIQTKLLRWFEKNKRDLPWRKTKDPYAILVSEIMLQQTQVTTVLPYYQRFLKSFPTIRHLARAELSRVLKIWEGLGYYSRARNLHRASQIVLKHFRGRIPNNLKDLVGLPGIGRSTAGAVLSFAFDMEAPILDGNAKRVLSRLFAVSDTHVPRRLSLRGGRNDRRSNPSENEIAAPFGLAMTRKDEKSLWIAKPLKGKADNLLWEISESLIPKGLSNPFNQALMDLGSMICIPKDPLCLLCPLRNVCLGNAVGNPEKFPAKNIKRKIRNIEAVSAVIQKDQKVLLKQRPPSGLLGGLWEFPNWKTGTGQRSRLRSRLRNYVKTDIGMNVEVEKAIGTFKQTFSHFKLTLHVYYCQSINGKAKGRWIPVGNMHLLPMSRIHRKIANTLEVNGLSLRPRT